MEVSIDSGSNGAFLCLAAFCFLGAKKLQKVVSLKSYMRESPHGQVAHVCDVAVGRDIASHVLYEDDF